MSNTKPKLLHVVMRFSGGIFTFLQDLTDHLSANYDITIAYAADNNTPSNVRSHFNERVQLIRINTYEEDHNPIADNATRTELKELFLHESPDLIHLHGYHAGRLGRRAYEHVNVPVLYTPHGYRFLAENHNRLTKSLLRRTEQALAQTSCMTVASSKGEFAETLGFTQNATYINNGINLELIDQLTSDIKQDHHDLRVFTTGLINPQKNPELFNEIAAAMPEVKFTWIGDGESKYKLTSSNIEITGWLEHDDAIRKIAEGDVFLLTSLWEGLPISLLEAMYLNKLCIVSNVVGSRDVITNGENGYICDSAAAFVNAINHYKDDDAKEIIQNGHDDVVNNYSLKRMITSYDELYKMKINQDK